MDVGSPIARITATPAEQTPAPAERAAVVEVALAPRPASGSEVPKDVTPPPEEHGVHVSPPVRHLAHTLGVDLGSLRGTGRNGGLTRADVERLADVPVPEVQAAPTAQGGPAEEHRVRSSPLACRVAAQLGVDLRGLPGSGPGGVVTETDVRRAAGVASGRQEKVPAAAESQSAEAPAVAAPRRSRKEVAGDKSSTLRQAIVR